MAPAMTRRWRPGACSILVAATVALAWLLLEHVPRGPVEVEDGGTAATDSGGSSPQSAAEDVEAARRVTMLARTLSQDSILVRGMVVDYAGSRVAGARLALRPAGTAGTESWSGVAGAAGGFELHVAAGDLRKAEVFAIAPGYRPATRLVTGEWLTLVLSEAVPAEISIRDIVTREPIRGAEVSTSDHSLARWELVGRSDEHGLMAAEFPIAANGLRCTADGYQVFVSDGYTGGSLPEMILMTPSREADIKLSTADGGPVRGVRFECEESSGFVEKAAVPIEAAPAGVWRLGLGSSARIRISSDGYQTKLLSVPPRPASRGMGVAWTDVDGRIQVEATLVPGCEIAGSLLCEGERVPAEVVLQQVKGDDEKAFWFHGRFRTDGTGAIRVGGLGRRATFDLVIRSSGCVERRLAVETGESSFVGLGSIVLERAVPMSLHGRVVTAGGAGVSDALILVKGVGGESRTLSDGEGYFTIDSEGAPEVLEVSKSAFCSVDLPVPVPAEDLLITLEKGGVVAGQVVDRDGLAVASATVILEAEDHSSSESGRTVADQDGRFVFEGVCGGPFMVDAAAPASRQEWSEAGIQVGQTVRVVLLRLGTVEVVLRGGVAGGRGGAWTVHVPRLDESGNGMTRKHDVPAGASTFSFLAPVGPCVVKVAGDAFAPMAAEVTVSAERKAVVHFEPQEAAEVEFRLVTRYGDARPAGGQRLVVRPAGGTGAGKAPVVAEAACGEDGSTSLRLARGTYFVELRAEGWVLEEASRFVTIDQSGVVELVVTRS